MLPVEKSETKLAYFSIQKTVLALKLKVKGFAAIVARREISYNN